MTTTNIGFSVLSAPLAATDRRALSQAWYSALHIAQAQPAINAPPIKPIQGGIGAPSIRPAQGSTTQKRAPLASAIAARRERVTRGAGASERRGARSLLARRIERELLCPGRAPSRATFSVAGSVSRVYVTLQQERHGLQLIAICSPRVRAAVARALEEARFALARRGIALDLLVKES